MGLKRAHADSPSRVQYAEHSSLQCETTSSPSCCYQNSLESAPALEHALVEYCKIPIAEDVYQLKKRLDQETYEAWRRIFSSTSLLGPHLKKSERLKQPVKDIGYGSDGNSNVNLGTLKPYDFLSYLDWLRKKCI